MTSELDLERLVRERTHELEVANNAWQKSEQLLAAELDSATRLQQVATQLITVQGTEALYEQILDATRELLHADFASIQMFYPERAPDGGLRLLGHRGLSEQAAKRWEWVAPSARTACGQALRTRQRVAVPDVRNCEFMAGTEDLEVFLSGGIRAVQSTPLLSRSGALLGVVSTHWRAPHELSASQTRTLDILGRMAADLIERLRAEDKVREALEELQLVTENMEAGVTRCSRDLRYLWVSRSYAAWLGLRPEEIAGRPIPDVIGDEAYQTIRPYIGQVVSGERTEYETQVNYRGGGKRWVHAVYVPMKGSDGKVDGWIGVVTDVTNQRRAQEESFGKQKLATIGTLASGIAHDFNNILGGLLAHAELGLAELAGGSSPEEELKQIRNASIQASEIVRQLMTYAGSDSEVLELVSVSRTVEEMLALLKVSTSKHAVLEIDLAQDLPAVRANSAQLRQIVLNLITNASEAIGSLDGVIRVTTARTTLTREAATSKGVKEGDYIEFQVSDTGCGMSLETQARIFDPFYTTKFGARGLGLAVVHGTVRHLGGVVSVASEPGKGATFQVLLPCGETAPVAARDPISVSPQSSRPPREVRVLMVEDENPLRQAVSKMLRKTGFAVLEAANGSAAIDLLRANVGEIEVMLLDMTIPGASSHEVIAEAAHLQPNLRVILTSAYGRDVVAANVDTSRIPEFIRKPYQLADLVKTLRSSLSS
jgi:PAS domain S-box-containing protein